MNFDVPATLGVLTLTGTVVAWILKQERDRTAMLVSSADKRLSAHEDICGMRYREISDSITTLQRHLEKQDEVSDKRHWEAQEVREKIASTLGTLSEKVAQLEETRRQTELRDNR